MVVLQRRLCQAGLVCGFLPFGHATGAVLMGYRNGGMGSQRARIRIVRVGNSYNRRPL